MQGVAAIVAGAMVRHPLWGFGTADRRSCVDEAIEVGTRHRPWSHLPRHPRECHFSPNDFFL